MILELALSRRLKLVPGVKRKTMRVDTDACLLRNQGGNGLSSKIEVNKEVRDDMLLAIKNYFLKERDEDLGDLAAILIFDFFMDKLAPHVYNQGVYDSYRYMSERAEDLLGLQRV